MTVAALLLSACTPAADNVSGTADHVNEALGAPELNALQDAAEGEARYAELIQNAERVGPSPDATLSTDLRKALRGPLEAAPEVTIVGKKEWRPVTGARLREHLSASVLHDPECDYGDVCDQIFPGHGKYLDSGILTETGRKQPRRGRVQIDNRRYCTFLQSRSRRCFALMERDDGLVFRVELGVRAADPRIVQLIPASRSLD